jgi:hypothetical protein
MTGPLEVISAGHCFYPIANPVKDMYAEVYDPTAPGKVRRIGLSDVRLKDGSLTNDLDLALIALKDEVDRQKTGMVKRSVPLALNGCDEDAAFVSAGFGVDETNEAGRLNFTSYRRLTSDERAKNIKQYSSPASADSTLLLSTLKGRVCGGDSGGPLFCRSRGRLVLAGIVTATGPSDSQQISIRPNLSTEKDCLARNILRAGDLKHLNNQLNRWRSELNQGSPGRSKKSSTNR